MADTMTATWSTRIPAAIAKAEARLRGAHVCLHHGVEGKDLAAITAGEVALAKALWGMFQKYGQEDDIEHVMVQMGDAPDVAALRAFCEKVEAL